LANDNRVLSSLSCSDILANLAPAAIDYVFVAPEIREAAQKWLEADRGKIIQPTEEVDS
jgi:hypothetical protein